MSNWTQSELDRIGEADELHLSSSRQNGELRKPVTIWVVRVGDELYVRAYKGPETPWFKHIQQRPYGRIEAGGVTKNVTLENVSADSQLHDQIDAAYKSKYHHYDAQYVDPMLTPLVRTSTLKLVPSAS